MNINNWLFADNFTLILVSIFIILILLVFIIFVYIMIIGFRRPGKIRKIAEKNGLKYEKTAKSNVVDLIYTGEAYETDIKNRCTGYYRGKQIEFYDLIHNDFNAPNVFRVLGETIIKIDNNVIWPEDYSSKVRDIRKGVTRPEDIFIIIDKYIDNKK